MKRILSKCIPLALALLLLLAMNVFARAEGAAACAAMILP